MYLVVVELDPLVVLVARPSNIVSGVRTSSLVRQDGLEAVPTGAVTPNVVGEEIVFKLGVFQFLNFLNSHSFLL